MTYLQCVIQAHLGRQGHGKRKQPSSSCSMKIAVEVSATGQQAYCAPSRKDCDCNRHTIWSVAQLCPRACILAASRLGMLYIAFLEMRVDMAQANSLGNSRKSVYFSNMTMADQQHLTLLSQLLDSHNLHAVVLALEHRQTSTIRKSLLVSPSCYVCAVLDLSCSIRILQT